MTDDFAADTELQSSPLEFPVIGIGASAGGHEPLLRFFDAMPADSGMAFVVLMHLAPEHASQLPEMLRARTRMPVVAPAMRVPIEANRVYVIPPNKTLSMNDGHLDVRDAEPPRGRPMVIDLFFRTLAIAHRQRSVAIVLSGSGTDGAVGIARIKEEGGLTFVQQPDEAQFDGMPRAAIASRAIDFVLPVAEMPARLVEVWRNAQAIELPAPVGPPVERVDATGAGEEALRRILDTLRARTGHDFSRYKRATVLRRLARRLQVNRLPNLQTYLARLLESADEHQALLKELLIGVTHFFRDPEAFEALECVIAADLLARPATRNRQELRVWVAGCSSGEEAFSIAMLLAERTADAALPPRISVFATDIDDEAISVARTAVFPESIATDVSQARLSRFFDREPNYFRVRKELRERITFAPQNILSDPPFSRLDLICCRNLLSHLHRDVHAEVLATFHFSLRPGGHLFLGNAESAEAPGRLFSVVDARHRIFRANIRVPAGSGVPLPLFGVRTTPAPRHAPPAASAGAPHLSHTELHRRVTDRYASPSVLVDREADIVHVSERAGRYLRHAAGMPSSNVLALVRPELRLELRVAIFQAVRTGKSVESRHVRMRDAAAGEPPCVQIVVRPVDESGATGLLLVLFVEVEETQAADAASDDRGTVGSQLEDELRHTKDQLQATIDLAETSMEELKASNEELQSINEELRSTSEELETSKEELQSINEELLTVNHELKSTVDETAKVNDDLRNFLASTDIATVFVDRSLTIRRYTPHATRLFNLIPGDVGRSLLDITHRLDYDELADDAKEAFRSLRLIEREVTNDDGRWYLARLLPYRTSDDRIDGAVLTFVDITSRHKAEAGMRRVAESTHDFAIISFGVDGRLETWNKGAELVFGHSESEALGLHSAMLFTPEDRLHKVHEEEMRKARDEGRAEDDRWHLRKDGIRIFCTGITTPLYQDGELRGYGKIARDVTGDKRFGEAREALLAREAAARVEAQASNEMKDEFLAVLSHELKNPLNLIHLNAELMARLPEARSLPSVQQAAETIIRTVHGQAQIIDDLLDLSRVNTGKLTLDRSAVDLAAIVGSIGQAIDQDAADKQIELRVEGPGLPVLLHADRVRVEQIVWNLVSNAIKFTPVGGHVTLRVTEEDGSARLDVVDDGRGIAAAFLPQVFEMFKQAESPAVRREGGMGIGLALVRHLTELHGGRVAVSSPGLGAGATFSVWLPLLAAPTQPVDALERAHALAGRRVLLVDDDVQSLDSLGRLLELEGLDTTTARDAAEALSLVDRGERFDIIVSDIGMPGMDGYALLQQLRARPSTAHTPVIALTGFGRQVDVQRALNTGFASHLSKPVPIDRVLQVLSGVL